MSTAVSRTIASRGTTKWERVLPYSVDELRDHLERQFKGAMSWGNYGRAWHIDHIRPVSSFRFVSPEDPAFSECWSLVNLRPLWRRSNIRKSDTWDGQTFLAM